MNSHPSPSSQQSDNDEELRYIAAPLKTCGEQDSCRSVGMATHGVGGLVEHNHFRGQRSKETHHDGEGGGKSLRGNLLQNHSIEVAIMRSIRSPYHHPISLGSTSFETTTGLSSSSPSSSSADDWLDTLEREEEDLHDHHGIGGDLTSAVMGIIKGMVGPAILYLPHGLAHSGYALAIPIILLATFLFLFSCQCLLDSWRLEHSRLLQQVYSVEQATLGGQNTDEKNEGEHDDSDSSTERSTLLPARLESDGKLELPHHKRTFFLSYPELAYRAFGTPFEQLVKLGITLMQSCVCLTYLIFVPQNLSTAVHLLWGGVPIAPEWFLILMIIIQVPLSFIQDIRKLTATNLLANLLILYGLIVCIALSLQMMTSDTDSTTNDNNRTPIRIIVDRLGNLEPFGNSWFLFIGTSVFMFEGSITVLVPLQEAVFTEKDRARFPDVNRNTILCIIAFYIFFSVTCWMALGDDVRTVLTTSLPPGMAATTVQLAYSVAVIFTFPLQNYPALEITSRSVIVVAKRGRWDVSKATLHNVTGTFLVLALAVVAVTTMDSLDRVVSFLGGLLGCPVAFIFPPLIHLRLAGNAGTLSSKRKTMNVVVSLMGVVAMVLSTTTTLL
jgi:solute carrier family 36 (proton-coupled amino acid transporter)